MYTNSLFLRDLTKLQDNSIFRNAESTAWGRGVGRRREAEG